MMSGGVDPERPDDEEAEDPIWTALVSAASTEPSAEVRRGLERWATRELFRRRFALWVCLLLAGSVILTALGVGTKVITVAEAKDLLPLLLTPLFTLLGVCASFLFKAGD